MTRVSSSLFLLLLLTCLINAEGQVRVKKLYDGDSCLSPEFGISPEPPYPQDTTVIEDYHLSSRLNCPTDKDELQLILLYDSVDDTIPNEGALYLNGKMVGFKLTWRGNELATLQEAENGVYLEIWNGHLTEIHSGISSPHRSQALSVKPLKNELEIDIRIYGDWSFPLSITKFRVGTVSQYIREQIKDEWIWHLEGY